MRGEPEKQIIRQSEVNRRIRTNKKSSTKTKKKKKVIIIFFLILERVVSIKTKPDQQTPERKVTIKVEEVNLEKV